MAIAERKLPFTAVDSFPNVFMPKMVMTVKYKLRSELRIVGKIY
ncbi:MAG: hypothetical protein CM15mP104_3080 [Gammaproteobacteria bacterium]|nr:MAG: hypothetical protein CM15mP104_3080 [Gammaproteobacteria bacterium]